MNSQPNNSNESRRGFIRGSSLLLASALPATRATAQPTKRSRLGLIGCGTSGVQLASAALEQGTVDLVSMADLSQSKLHQATRALKGRLGSRYQVSREHRLLGGDAYRRLLQLELDWVIIAVPYALRAPFAEAALQAGKHIYIEQPIATSPQEFAQLLDCQRQAGRSNLKIWCGNRTAWNLKYEESLQAIQSGLIGSVREVFADTCIRWNPQQAWRQDFQIAGDGSLQHRSALANIARSVFGSAVTSAKVESQVEYAEGLLDSRVRVQFETGSLVSRCRIGPHRPSSEEVIRVIGSKGHCELHRGRFFDQHGKLVHRTKASGVSRGCQLLDGLARNGLLPQGIGLSDENCPSVSPGDSESHDWAERNFADALTDIEVALMAQAAGRSGKPVDRLVSP